MQEFKLSNAESNGLIYLLHLEGDIYKIGKTTNLETRLFFFTLNHGRPVQCLVTWQVPDLDFCEYVALGMTSPYTIEWTEKRILTEEQLKSFIKTFSGFVEYMDNPDYQTDTEIIKFVCWDNVNHEIISGGFTFSKQMIIRVSIAIVRDKVSFARIPLCDAVPELTQLKYTKLRDILKSKGFLKKADGRPNSAVKITATGWAFFEELAGEKKPHRTPKHK